MADKIAQTMITLAEDNRDVKMSLRLLLKYEIQSLLERLSSLGDDSLLILTNANEGTCSHLGTSNADNFLQHLQTNACINLKDTFQKFCINSSGLGTCITAETMQPTRNESQFQNEAGNQSMMKIAPLLNLPPQLNSLNSMITSPQQHKQPQFPTRFSPYMGVPARHNTPSNLYTGKSPEELKPLKPEVMERKKRNACRHFLSKGYCWQGSSCAFLHTRDSRILDSLGITLTSAEDNSQTPSSSSIEGQGQSQKEPVSTISSQSTDIH